MDWYSRYVLSWRVSNTLEADFCVDALEEALSKGKPEVFNTDQGSQFTSEAFTGLLEQHGVRVSMDGKGRYTDNLFIERLWRSLKYEEVYLKAYTGGRDARIGIGEYFRFYNTERPHQALEYQTPAEVFISNNHVVTQGNDVQSGNPLTSLEALEAADPLLTWPLFCPTDWVHLNLFRGHESLGNKTPGERAKVDSLVKSLCRSN